MSFNSILRWCEYSKYACEITKPHFFWSNIESFLKWDLFYCRYKYRVTSIERKSCDSILFYRDDKEEALIEAFLEGYKTGVVVAILYLLPTILEDLYRWFQ
jgi:CRISPR/Cas system-associated endoribonuclease Cas2